MEKEKKVCKHCKSEIPKDAKICPHCRKKQGGILKWGIIAIIVLLIVGAAASGGGDEPERAEKESDTAKSSSDESSVSVETKEPEEKSEEEMIFTVGETAEMNDIQMTLTEYSESHGSEYNMPSEGNEFVLIKFEIANNSDKEINISSMASFEAYADDYALNYSLQALLENESENQLDGTIAPGKRMSGVIGYEVPAEWSSIEVHFTDSLWNNNKWKFEIAR